MIDEKAYRRTKGLADNPTDILRNAILELTDIQMQLSKDRKAYKELFYLLHNDLYADNYVKLKDLLDPDNSLLYNKMKVPEELKGAFKNAFNAINNSQNYPNLNYLLSRNNYQQRSSAVNQPDFLDSADLAYYMPYPEDENGQAFTDQDNPTYVPTVIEDENRADYGYGYKEENGQWNTYITDDNYAQQNSTIQVTTLIGEIHINPNGDNQDDDITIIPPDQATYCANFRGDDHPYNHLVILGHLQLTEQLDPWVGLYNSGGSELIFLRIDSEELIPLDGQHIELTTGQVARYFRVDLRRREIKKMRRDNTFKWIGAQWDINWECSEPVHEQGFLVYELDNRREFHFDFGEISFELNSQNISADIDITLELPSGDDVV
ncbi:MAG: hypothetical protein GXO24_01390, partial [Chlorobi bacterium]|nr:hypothetical protein [Chlorobiota bacterium]